MFTESQQSFTAARICFGDRLLFYTILEGRFLAAAEAKVFIPSGCKISGRYEREARWKLALEKGEGGKSCAY